MNAAEAKSLFGRAASAARRFARLSGRPPAPPAILKATAMLVLVAFLCIPSQGAEGILRSGPLTAPPDSVIHLLAHSHIDVAWLWRYDPETIEDCARATFLRALDNMDRFPDYRYIASQVPLYEPLADRYPELFARIRQRIQERRWEVAGGHFVEFEGAGPSGESLVRQCLYGQRAWKKLFGIEATTAWQEDAWTHPATLPQILAQSGMKSYMFKRGAPGERCFLWEGLDGTRLLACNPVYTESVDELAKFAKEMRLRLGVRHVAAGGVGARRAGSRSQRVVARRV
jgi:alpha-mannosidase